MAKVTSNIVSAGTLLNIAKRIRTVAAGIARSKNVPLLNTNWIGIRNPRVTQGLAEIELTLPSPNSSGKKSPKYSLAAYEWGSGLHATRKGGRTKGYVVIQAKRKPWLVFMGTKKARGKLIRTKAVFHPGVKARPFIAPAKQLTRKQNLEDIRKETNRNIRLQIGLMARKV